MKNILLLIFFFCFAQISFGQPPPPPPPPPPKIDTTTGEVIEQSAQFPGGDQALMKFISSNINWPACCDSAMYYGTQGKVYIKFVIEKDGSVSNVEALKYPKGKYGEDLAKEAIRVVRLLPKWIPAQKDGKAVRIYYTVPINFKIG